MKKSRTAATAIGQAFRIYRVKKKFYLHKLKTDPNFSKGSSTYLKMLMDKIQEQNKQPEKENHFMKKKMSMSMELVQLINQKSDESGEGRKLSSVDLFKNAFKAKVQSDYDKNYERL